MQLFGFTGSQCEVGNDVLFALNMVTQNHISNFSKILLIIYKIKSKK